MISPSAIFSKRASRCAVLWATLAFVAGLFALALPLEASFGAVVVIGWLLIFSCVFQVLLTFQSKGIGNVQWKLLISAFYFCAGVYLFTHPVLGMVALALALAIFFLAEGVAALIPYF